MNLDDLVTDEHRVYIESPADRAYVLAEIARLKAALARVEAERDTLREFRTAVSVTLSLSGPDDGAEELAMIAWLQTQLAQAEQALRAVEWVLGYGTQLYCPWCGRDKQWTVAISGEQRGGHAPDCPRQAALRAVAGGP